MIQAILFDKSKFSTAQARKFLKKNGYIPIKRVHTTKTLHRYRIKTPDPNKKFRIKTIKPGIKMVYEY